MTSIPFKTISSERTHRCCSERSLHKDTWSCHPAWLGNRWFMKLVASVSQLEWNLAGFGYGSRWTLVSSVCACSSSTTVSTSLLNGFKKLFSQPWLGGGWKTSTAVPTVNFGACNSHNILSFDAFPPFQGCPFSQWRASRARKIRNWFRPWDVSLEVEADRLQNSGLKPYKPYLPPSNTFLRQGTQMTFTHSTRSSSGLVAEMAARTRIKTTPRTGSILGMLEVAIGMGIEHKGYSDYEDP